MVNGLYYDVTKKAHVSLYMWPRVRFFYLLVYSLFVCMESSIGKALVLKLSEEHAVTDSDVVDFISGTAAIHSLPLLGRLLTFPTDIIKTL